MKHTTSHTLGDLTIHAAQHFDPQVRAAGFPLGHSYTEKCWGPVLGPTAIMVLRRANDLWADDLSPTIDSQQLARMVGLGKSAGVNSPLWNAITRLERFRFARADAPGQLSIWTEVPPLDARALGRIPEWSRTQHYQLIDEHLNDLAAQHNLATEPKTLRRRPYSRQATLDDGLSL